VGGALSSSGFVPIVLTTIFICMNFFINQLKRKENDMEQTKSKDFKKEVPTFLISILTTIWTIGTSATAAVVLNI
jgi:hypothetical protein